MLISKKEMVSAAPRCSRQCLNLLLIALLELLLPGISMAQSDPMLHPNMRDMKNPWERFTEGTLVSGNTKVGAVPLEDNQKISPTQFYVRLPEHSFAFLNVDVSSRDGKYEAKLIYDVKGKKGTYGLDLPTLYLEKLSNYTTNDLTILARISNRDNTENFYYVLSSWNKQSLDAEDIVVYLLSDDQTYLQLKNNHRPIEKFGCETIEGPSSRAYNTKCVVKLKSEGVFALEIIQRVPKKPTGYRYFPISFPFKH
jgi:hypothetical protein